VCGVLVSLSGVRSATSVGLCASHPDQYSSGHIHPESGPTQLSRQSYYLLSLLHACLSCYQ
ncbi:hypothetical protein LSTR_LSTR017070, partial [Laodelphax striatellus]